MGGEEPSRRSMDAELYRSLGNMEANIKTATAQTAELFGLVRELREETPSKADFLALSIEQRTHMSVDMREHGEFRDTMKGLAALLFDPHDDSKGLIPEHREMMENHAIVKTLRRWAVFGICILPPGIAGILEVWEKLIIPWLKAVVMG